MDSLNNIISTELVKKGISLESFGISEYAWDSDNVKMVLSELADKKISILGGDAYRVVDNIIEMTFDSWYINDDGSIDFYQKSNDKAMDYIAEYEKNNCGKYIYSLVI